MKLRTRLDVFSATLLSALGASQVVACGGTVFTSGEGGAGGSSGAGTAGASSSGAPGSAGSGTAGGTASAGSTGSGGSGNQFPCKHPVDVGTGIITCDGGLYHRESAVTCTSKVPRPDPIPSTIPSSECTSDADCVAHPYGFCTFGGQLPGAYCNYGCIKDNDCTGNQLCACGDPVGECVQADCKSAADCGAGYMCKGYDSSLGCGITKFTCQSAADTCGSDTDCANGTGNGMCTFDLTGQHFKCVSGGCAIGRPFLVEGAARMARVSKRADWNELALLPSLENVDANLASILAEEWTRVALMEHASIAAFARFTLQLMSLGAPAQLIELATAAMADETKHAKACFAVASAYAGAPVGPGPLAIDNSLDETALADIVLNTIREGCVGETVAAIEAREAAEHAKDPALQALLLVISEDETRHAELAFRFVQWALSNGDDELASAVHAEFAALRTEPTRSAGPLRSAEADPSTTRLLELGVTSPALRAAIRTRAISDVILPSASALQGGERAGLRGLQAARLHCECPS